jgi:hypothetical protein
VDRSHIPFKRAAATDAVTLLIESSVMSGPTKLAAENGSPIGAAWTAAEKWLTNSA